MKIVTAIGSMLMTRRSANQRARRATGSPRRSRSRATDTNRKTECRRARARCGCSTAPKASLRKEPAGAECSAGIRASSPVCPCREPPHDSAKRLRHKPAMNAQALQLLISVTGIVLMVGLCRLLFGRGGRPLAPETIAQNLARDIPGFRAGRATLSRDARAALIENL